MKKKLIAISLVVAMLAVAVIGGSLAYFTDTKSAENTFTAGGVKINLIEQEGYGSDSDETYFFWIGGRRYNVETDYYWVDVEGNRIGDSLNDEPYWLSNEPSFESDGETERYMNMFYTEKSGYIWNDVPNDLVELSSYYSGRIAYIVEIED